MTPISLSLRLLPDPKPTPFAPSAWLLSGADLARWLAELADCGVTFEDVRLCLIPVSPHDRRPAGALVILREGRPFNVPRPTLMQPYELIAGRLYIPAGTVLFPPVTDRELADLLHFSVQVLHPGLGLIGFTENDLIRPADLLAPPVRSEARWDRARPGVMLSTQLKEVLPQQPPTAQMVLQAVQDDIGGQSPDELPPLKEESGTGRAGSEAKRRWFDLLRWMAEHTPRLPGGGSGAGIGGAGGPGWLDRMSRWARNRSQHLQQNLDDARQRELARLMKLLAENLDEGLKYALPLRDLPGRGVAPPGARLTPHGTSFDPNAMNRTGPIDAWSVGIDYQARLRQTYHGAARRELALGRYNRAAYIYAQLLGDFSSAANALRQGRMFREAAALYLDQVKDRRQAAACLEAGGLLTEAVPLYEQLGEYEKVGDLCTQLARPEEAADAYHKAAKKWVSLKEPIRAAAIHEKKLKDPDGALALLDVGWPTASLGKQCLSESFAIMTRHARHEQAADRINRLLDDPQSHRFAVQVVDVLVEQARGIPEASLRARSADAARVVAGRRLTPAIDDDALEPRPALDEVRALVGHIARLEPGDRLLARDTSRFVDQFVRPPRKPAPPPPLPAAKVLPMKRASKEPTLLRSFHLGQMDLIKAARAAGDMFYAIGVRGDRVLTIRGQLNGTTSQYVDRFDPLAMQTDYCIEFFDSSHRDLLAMPLRRADAVLPADFGPDSQFPPIHLKLPPDFSPGQYRLHDAFLDERNVLWTTRSMPDGDYAHCQSNDATGRLLSTVGLKLLPESLTNVPIQIVAREGTLFILHGDLIRIAHRQPTTLPRPGVRMAISAPNTRRRLAITYDIGGDVRWPEEGLVARFGEGLADPVCCWATDGTLIVVGCGRGLVLRADGGEVTVLSTFESTAQAPAAVVPVTEPPGFAMFHHDGLVQVMKLPAHG